jgi:hypothetical protein
MKSEGLRFGRNPGLSAKKSYAPDYYLPCLFMSIRKFTVLSSLSVDLMCENRLISDEVAGSKTS